MESIEIESEILGSDSSPSVLALCIMCIYEYAQRGNLIKMRSRAGQALVLAMDMSLHSQGEIEDEFSEAKRRAWWMCVSIRGLQQILRQC